MRGTANPLLIVRATEEAKAEGDAEFKTVIVPLDGSELAESVLPAVAELAKTLGLEVRCSALTTFRTTLMPVTRDYTRSTTTI